MIPSPLRLRVPGRVVKAAAVRQQPETRRCPRPPVTMDHNHDHHDDSSSDSPGSHAGGVTA
eukprot:1693360-Rhodomonas_salina.2